MKVSSNNSPSIICKPLSQIKRSDMLALMNNPLVRKHMPLLKGYFNKTDFQAFISAKNQLWQTHGYGPRAFVINGHFAGWGGLQPQDGEVDLALVLHPDYWGLGHVLYQQMMHMAFSDMGLKSITILIPPTRTQIKGLIRLGFKKETDVLIKNERFIKYRLEKKYNAPDPNNNYGISRTYTHNQVASSVFLNNTNRHEHNLNQFQNLCNKFTLNL